VGKRGKSCPICTASDPLVRAKGESLRETGSSLPEITALVPGFDRWQWQRHFKHMQAVVAPAPADALAASERRLAQLQERTEASWLAAASSGDAKSCLEILKAQIRMTVDHHERLLEKQQETIENSKDDGQPSAAWVTGIVEKVRNSYQRAIDNGAIWCPCCGRYPVDSEKAKNYANSIAN
jgi:hypothetical protein